MGGNQKWHLAVAKDVKKLKKKAFLSDSLKHNSTAITGHKE